jgi:REP element-mobilizing transposase RayT
MNRAARRKTIFRNDSDCILFLDTLGDTARRFHLEVHAYSLMPNHYHLLLRSTEGNLSRAMRHLNSIFTQRLNRANGWDGPVFRGRFASRLIHDETYLNCVLAYIHLNPLKANLITRLDADRSWTSHRAYLEKDTPPEWLHLDVMLARFGGKEALHETILGLHRGKLAWPEIGFSSETGFPAAVTFTRAERRSLGKENTPTVDERHALLAKICDITGVSLPRLKKRILENKEMVSGTRSTHLFTINAFCVVGSGVNPSLLTLGIKLLSQYSWPDHFEMTFQARGITL